MANTKFVKEVTRVRNSKKNLLGILRDIKIPDARAILIIQILKNAYEDYKKGGEKKLLFETLWAIEDAVRKGSLPTCNAPKPLDDKSVLVKDPSLVYDDYSEVEKLLKKARKVMSQESDMIKLQLVEMSDSLVSCCTNWPLIMLATIELNSDDDGYCMNDMHNSLL